MPNVIDFSKLQFQGGKVGVVVSLYNRHITKSLEAAAVETLKNAGVIDEDITVVYVPGAWELPSAVSLLQNNQSHKGFVCLGAVIKGDTTHDQHINTAVSNELMRFSADWNIPVGFGLLTCNNVEQALERSGGAVGNKGEEAASTVVDMMKIASVLPEDTDQLIEAIS